MTTHLNYSLQDFSMNNAKVLTGNSQPVTEIKSVDELWFIKKCQNCTFKINFRNQKSTEFKKNLGLGQIFCPKD
jgi:hypothetical protein